MEASLRTNGDIPSSRQVCHNPQKALDHPFDVTLVVENGKQVKAHRRVLSDGSPFFEKVLNTDMKESKEGIIRLEMLTEVCLRDILEFIYTGNVQISGEGNARELIAMADYLVLPRLKTIAERFLARILRLEVTNAISTYLFADRYRRSAVHNKNTRGCNNFVVPRCRLSMGQRAFYFRGPREWNGLADNIKNTKEIGSFKRTLFKNMFHTK